MVVGSSWVKVLDNASGIIANVDNLGRSAPASIMLKEGVDSPSTYEGVMYLAEGAEIVLGRCSLWARAASVGSTAYLTILPAPSALSDSAGRSSPEYMADSWGRSKSVIDTSVLHGMFTYNVPADKWRELHEGVEQPEFTYATSVNGKLNLSSTSTVGTSNGLSTFRSPRYQPNRGHIYSSSILLPNAEATGTRRFGIFNAEGGVFFELRDGTLYAVVRTTVDSVQTFDEYIIDTSNVDLSKGNVFDIQMQWRGVGNYTFYVNLLPVMVINYLGTLTELSISNPAKPIAFESICTDGTDVSIQCGCVDVSSEGGDDSGGTYGAIGVDSLSGQVAITGYNVPIIAFRSKEAVNGMINTRDTLALLASAYGDQRAMLRVWVTRDSSAVTTNDQVWRDFGDGHAEYITYDIPNVATPMGLDTAKAKLVFTCRVNQDETYATSALFEGRADIYITPGDTMVFTMHRETGQSMNAGVTFEFSEDI